MIRKKSKKLSATLKFLGPGLLFASSAIGTSHLVLSTRAGAHHGMIFFWIILGALIFKYPFYEFGPRYASATGNSLLKGYKDQGMWAVVLFMLVIFINMFAVTGAVSAVCAGLLSSMMGMSSISMPFLVGGVLSVTGLILVLGKYTVLDNFIKVISVVLLVTMTTAFLAVIIKGRVTPITGFQSPSLLEGAGLALLISLIGWMPAGMEASTMHSFWILEKSRTTHYKPTLKESLFDFNLGYIFTIVLALMFMTIGAFTVYGSGQLLEGNSTQFANNLLGIFTANLGQWAYPVIALAAFGTIYGTLITVWDAFTRSFVRGLRIFKFEEIEDSEQQQKFLTRNYNILLPVIGIGGFMLFCFSASSMIVILQWATIIAFITSPIIAFLNLRSIQSDAVPVNYKPRQLMIILAYLGLLFMILFSIYFVYDLIV